MDPSRFGQYFGFTKTEIKALSPNSGIDFQELEKWYDGYQIGDQSSMFNPNSVREALDRGRCSNYWNSTGAYEAVSAYIKINYEGLKESIIDMLAGGRCRVDCSSFGNDINLIKNKDDVLALLIHLGYLAYNQVDKSCYIPNLEVREEMQRAVQDVKWDKVTQAIHASEALMNALVAGNQEEVAQGVEKVHQKETSILSYNDENSLACVIGLAFYSAQNDYIIHRELATGKGYADLIFIPRPGTNKPGIIMELKCNRDTTTAMEQIKAKDYMDKVREYTNDIILVGINYDTNTKQHTCEIEKRFLRFDSSKYS